VKISKICGPGFPKSAVQKILYPTLSGERSNWISTFYSGVDTNAFISSPIIFSSKFPSLISSTRRLDVIFSSLLLTHTSSQLLHPYHLYSTVYPLCPTTSNTRTSLPPTHIPLFCFKKKTKSSQYWYQFVKNNTSKGAFQNIFKEATACAGLALIPTLYRFFKNIIIQWSFIKY
jgi:hypothetical protein